MAKQSGLNSLKSRLNNKGFGMVEVVIAIFLTLTGILAVFSLVSPAWTNVGKSDNLGRASGILYEQLMRQEARIMNPCCTVAAQTIPAFIVYPSGQSSAQSGDVQFTVNTVVSSITSNTWLVSVRVSWPGHTGISESLVVTRQEGFVFPSGCTVGGLTCQ